MKPDDSLPPEQLEAVRREAKRILQKADVLGVVPTPIEALLRTAKVEVSEEDALDPSFLRRLRQSARGALKRALSKVRGVYDAVAGLIYLDRSVAPVRQTFLKLHELGHGWLPWQRGIYRSIEDCEKTIHPDVAEAFEREANAFASEVLFQCETFTEEAADRPLEIWTPVRLAKTYRASIYSTVRRYVRTHRRPCAVLVLDPPVASEEFGFVAMLRRVEVSDAFGKMVGPVRWPTSFTPSSQLGDLIPIGRRASRPREIVVSGGHGSRHRCIAEAFTQGYQVFILICPQAAAAPSNLLAV